MEVAYDSDDEADYTKMDMVSFQLIKVDAFKTCCNIMIHLTTVTIQPSQKDFEELVICWEE